IGLTALIVPEVSCRTGMGQGTAVVADRCGLSLPRQTATNSTPLRARMTADASVTLNQGAGLTVSGCWEVRGGSTMDGELEVTRPTNRYPSRGIVCMNRGLPLSSPSALRISRTA